MIGISYINQGIIEVYAGAMLTGKTEEMFLRLKKIKYMPGNNIICFKPSTDTRNPGYIYSRVLDMRFDAEMIAPGNEKKIIELAKMYGVVGIDEAQFFSDKLPGVLEYLSRQGKNVLISGLDLDYKGEPFGSMPKIMSIADYVKKTHGVCTVPNCGGLGTRTQLLIDGKPAPYSLDSIRPEDNKQKLRNERYELRCLEHHVVPGKPI